MDDRLEASSVESRGGYHLQYTTGGAVSCVERSRSIQPHAPLLTRKCGSNTCISGSGSAVAVWAGVMWCPRLQASTCSVSEHSGSGVAFASLSLAVDVVCKRVLSTPPPILLMESSALAGSSWRHSTGSPRESMDVSCEPMLLRSVHHASAVAARGWDLIMP